MSASKIYLILELLFLSTLNRPKSCHVLRNVSDDEAEDENDAKTFDSRNSHSKNQQKEDMLKSYDGIDNTIVGLQNKVSNSCSLNTLEDVSSAFNQISNKKEEGEAKVALRENTFITDDNNLPSNASLSNPNSFDKFSMINDQTQISYLSIPQPTFDLKLSRHTRLNFDQIKTDLTATRRGVFIIQALRWVSLNSK